MLASFRPPRAASAALAAALAGVAPLIGSVAARGDVGSGQPEAGSQVRFRGGGLLGLGVLPCASDPDQSDLRVDVGTMVTFVNYTGRRAVLQVDGQDAATVGANQAVPVVFHRGPVTISMIPECRFNLSHTSGSVTVSVPSASDPWNSSSGGSEGAFSGGDSADLTLIGDPAAAATGKVAIAPPVPATPAPTRASGLAALVAAVCVVGVSAGAIRAILTQRVSRTLAA